MNAKETGGYGVAEHLDWVKPVANVALFESMCCGTFCVVCLKDPN